MAYKDITVAWRPSCEPEFRVDQIVIEFPINYQELENELFRVYRADCEETVYDQDIAPYDLVAVIEGHPQILI